jgi:hypothetical protein
MTADELLKAHKENQTAPDLDLRGIDLSNKSLVRAELPWALLSSSNLRGAVFRYANLRGADLSSATAHQAHFQEASLIRAKLNWANLSDCIFIDANLNGAELIKANLRGADLTRAKLVEADLTGANLSSSLLTRANLTGANLTWANLANADLEGACLAGTILSKVTGNGYQIKSAQLGPYHLVWTKWELTINFQMHPIEEWWDLVPPAPAETDDEDEPNKIEDVTTNEGWAEDKAVIRALVERFPATA